MINLYKGVEIDSNYNIVYDVSSDASFLSFLSKYLKITIDDNFNFQWITSTSATITIDNDSLDIDDCLNFNYLCYEENYKYFYFFILKAECNSNQSTTYTLSLDVWSTYGYRELASTNPTLYIDRAHCKRFDTKDTINYDLPQMLTPESGTQQRNVVDDVQLFSSSKTYLLVQCAYDTTQYKSTKNPSGLSLPTLCILAPIESGSTITIPPATSIAFEASLLYGVARNRDINISLDLDDPVTVKGTVVSISVITLPLGLTGSLNSTVSNDYVEGNTCKLTALNEAQAVDWYCYAFFVKQFKKLFDSQTTNLSYCALRVIKYPSSPTALSNWDKMVEPKLLSYPFTSFNFVDYHKQYSDYNLYKIFSDSNVQYLYHYNVFGSGVFQDFLCFSRTHPYYGYNKKYGIGEVTNYGDTLGFGTDSYAEWCRNNSTSAQTNLALGVVGGAVSVIGGALMTAVNPLVGGAGVVGGATSIATSIAKYEANKSDIANARETFSQPSANILFSESFNINLPYGYQIKTIGEEDRNLVSSYFYYNGYAYNSTEKFLTAIGTRCMFNYIQSSDALIKASIKESEDIKNKVLEILSKGCEIWSLSFLTGNSKTITESRGIYANYEKDIL